MGLHYFHANMTLEMVYCSAGIWGVMHLIASCERVCVYLCIFISKLTYLCVCVHGAYSFALPWSGLSIHLQLCVTQGCVQAMLWDPPGADSNAVQGVNAFSFELPPEKPDSKALHP